MFYEAKIAQNTQIIIIIIHAYIDHKAHFFAFFEALNAPFISPSEYRESTFIASTKDNMPNGRQIDMLMIAQIMLLSGF